MVPELGQKLSLFIALAPAVFAGPLTTGFPFTYLKSMKWKTWRRWFGELYKLTHFLRLGLIVSRIQVFSISFL